jgi:FkbM family methyltransferase
MKIFVDIGANSGQSAQAALDPRFGFDRIVCFEPAPVCWAAIEAIEDPRVELHRFGLWNRTCRRDLYDPGALHATIFEGPRGRPASATTIDLVRASDWFRDNLPAGHVVFVKLNCEGSECDIVEDLSDGGHMQGLYNVMIDFDVRKNPALRARELTVRRALRRAGLRNVAFSEDVMRGPTHEARIGHWLDLVGAPERLPLDELRRKYEPVLVRLSSRSGRFARVEERVRSQILPLLPPVLQGCSKCLWRHVVRPRARRRAPRLGTEAPAT